MALYVSVIHRVYRQRNITVDNCKFHLSLSLMYVYEMHDLHTIVISNVCACLYDVHGCVSISLIIKLLIFSSVCIYLYAYL